MTTQKNKRNFPFTVIIVTNPDEKSARSAQRLLNSTLKRYFDDNYDTKEEIKIISTYDPFGARCGSFGGTLAALELIGKENNVNETVLCLHAGGDSSRCPLSMILGKAWINLPSYTFPNPTAWLINQLEDLFYRARIPKGSLLVTATDCLISLGQHDILDEEICERIAVKKEEVIDPYTVLGVCVPAPLNTAKNHGVYVLPEQHSDDIRIETPVAVLQKPSVSDLLLNDTTKASFDTPHRSGKQAWIDVGIVVFFPKAFQTIKKMSDGLLALCTRKGIETAYHATASEPSVSLETFAKENALKIDLYTDILHNLPLAGKGKISVDNERIDSTVNYLIGVSNTISTTTTSMNKDDMDNAIRSALSTMSLRVLVVRHGIFLHLGTTQELIEFITNNNNDDVTVVTTNMIRTTEISTIMDEYVTKSLSAALKLNPRFKTFQAPADNILSSHQNVTLCCTFPSDTKKTLLGSSTFVEYSDLENYESVSIGNYCMMSGWRNTQKQSGEHLQIPSALSVQLLPLVSETEKVEIERFEEKYVIMVLGTTDSIKTPFQDSKIYGVQFLDFLDLTGVSSEDLGFKNIKKDSIWTAQVHPIVRFSNGECSIPFSSLFGWLEKLRAGDQNIRSDDSLANWISADRVSLKDLHGISDAVKEWMFRIELESKIWRIKCERHIDGIITLLKERCQNIPYDIQWLSEIENYEESFAALCALVNTLEDLAIKEMSCGNFDISGRALMLASVSLADFSDAIVVDNQCDRNLHKKAAVHCKDMIDRLKRSFSRSLQIEEKLEIMKEIVKLRRTQMPVAMNMWDATSCSKITELLALQCIKFAVAAGFNRYLDPIDQTKISINRRSKTIRDKCVFSIAPVRVDLAGGWSDTPPICYEYGGSVTGMAVLIDDYFPLSCRCRIISGGGILLRSEIRDLSTGSLLSHTQEEVVNIAQLQNFRDPLANCALLKATLICLGMISEEQIMNFTDIQILINQFCSSVDNVRIEIVTTSLLRMGTGMGTSSILGACVFQTIAVCVGIGKMTDEFLLHAVLMLEQLLSSGGGWQDQALGIVPGVKTVRSTPKIPLEIKIDRIEISNTNVSAFEDRLLFVFTGKTRLAKNILQQVLRRWSRRTKEIVDTVENLVNCSTLLRDAFLNESWNKIGEHMYESYKLKCVMAGERSGAEPESVSLFISELMIRDRIKGAMLCGAGGGGFLLLLLSEGVSRNNISSTYEESIRPLSEDFDNFTFHSCRIAQTGLTTSTMDDKSIDFKLSLQYSKQEQQ
mmetsp:Transcript_41753/g.46610  ORF Transcript_41753/g.46610 Transcript_41753/m.46610 type:complete len:1263 (-) Transcript_41753:750-4538(-)